MKKYKNDSIIGVLNTYVDDDWMERSTWKT
jgi:hypothetical protein